MLVNYTYLPEYSKQLINLRVAWKQGSSSKLKIISNCIAGINNTNTHTHNHVRGIDRYNYS